MTDAQVRQAIIEESISSYPGNCPCPYNYASNGSRCGGRSAYSRPGGYSPLCYPSDVSQAMVDAYSATGFQGLTSQRPQSRDYTPYTEYIHELH